MKYLSTSIRSCALGIAILGMTISAFGQAPSKQTPPDPQPQTQTTSPSNETPASSQSSQTFQGTISQSETGYVLKDSTGVTYQLDDQKKAKDFTGQSVKVTGSLDASTNLIRVASIAPAS
jgi:hypothetical protein